MDGNNKKRNPHHHFWDMRRLRIKYNLRGKLRMLSEIKLPEFVIISGFGAMRFT